MVVVHVGSIGQSCDGKLFIPSILKPKLDTAHLGNS